MKSILIIVALCSLFIATFGFKPAGIRPYFSITPEKAHVLQPLDGHDVRAVEKPKAGKLPRWHRVIPGMFR